MTTFPPQPNPTRISLAYARASLSMARFAAAAVQHPRFGSDADRRRARRTVREAERRVERLERRL